MPFSEDEGGRDDDDKCIGCRKPYGQITNDKDWLHNLQEIVA